MDFSNGETLGRNLELASPRNKDSVYEYTVSNTKPLYAWMHSDDAALDQDNLGVEVTVTEPGSDNLEIS